MKKGTRVMLLMATAQTMMELAQGLEVDTDLSEIVGSLNMAGLNGDHIMRNHAFIQAIQIVCGEIASIKLTDQDLAEMVIEDAEDDTAAY